MTAGTMVAIDVSSNPTQSTARAWRQQNLSELVRWGVPSSPPNILSGGNASGNALNQVNAAFSMGIARRTLADRGGGSAAAFFGYPGLFTCPEGAASDITDIFFNRDTQIYSALVGGRTAREAYDLATQAYRLGQAQLVAKYPEIGTQFVGTLETNPTWVRQQSVRLRTRKVGTALSPIQDKADRRP